jgi:MFS family permease
MSTTNPMNSTVAADSWTPMIAIALGQALMSFNVAALPVSMGGMVRSFDVPPTTVGTGIVLYSLSVAGFVMLGAKLCQRFGAVGVFRVVIALFGVAQILMTFSPVAWVMLLAQLLSGLAAAVIVPSLVALIAHHYQGQQQATAVGALGSARAAAGVTAFLLGGVLGTFIGWRPLFGLLIGVAALVFVLSFRLRPTPGRPEVRIDLVGVVLAASAMILITLGFNNLNRWGLGAAQAGAPFDLLGLSPAPVMVVIGIVLLNGFVVWARREQAAGRTPLLDLRVISSGRERAAVLCLFAVVLLEAMLNFSVPLYIQIIQGRTALETAVAMLPFNLTVFFTALLVVHLYPRFTPRRIGQGGFVVCTAALLWLAFVVHNDWSALPVMFGLITFGIGQGALVTLLFNVLVTASPKEIAGDVGSLRGTTQNLAAGVGTAVAGALLVGLLSTAILARLAGTPTLNAQLQEVVDLDNITFVTNERLLGVLERTSATPAQVAEAVQINVDARLKALKMVLLLMSGVALLFVFPARWLPDYRPGAIPDDPPPLSPEELRRASGEV